MSDIRKPSVVLQRTSTRKKTEPKKYKDLTPDYLNQEQPMTNPYEKRTTARFRPSEKRTDVMNPYKKTAPPRSKPISEAKPNSSSASSFKRTAPSPYKTPPRSSSARLSKHTMTNRTSAITRQLPSVSTSSKQSISAKLLKAASTHCKFKPFRPLPSPRVIDLSEATETASLALASNQNLR